MLAVLMLPAFVGSILVSVTGFWRRSIWWPLARALLAAPLSLYLAATPRFRWVGLFPILCHLVAALAVRYERRWISLTALLPIPLFLGWFAWEMSAEGSAPMPPAPQVTAGGVMVPLLPPQACWEEQGSQACTGTPPKVVERSGLAPAAAPAGSLLTVTYPVRPQFWGIHVWQDGRPHRPAVDRSGAIRLPDTPGLYVYDLAARWRQGSASWVIYLKLE